jgi:hypothetical protein
MRSVRRERVSGLFFGTPAVTLNASKADIVTVHVWQGENKGKKTVYRRRHTESAA